MADHHDNHALPYLVALAIVLALLMAGSTLIAAELDTRPELWVYTASWCGPCQRLHRDQESGNALRGFNVHYIDAPRGLSIPVISYWKASGNPGYFTGWGPGAESRFLKQWQRDQKGI